MQVRHDFGRWPLKPYFCKSCGTAVFNRGCAACQGRFCQNCFQSHACPALHYGELVQDFEQLDARGFRHVPAPVPQPADAIGASDVFVAAASNDIVSLGRLLTRKADPNQGLPDGNAPLAVASRDDQCDAVRLLLAARADINKKNNNGATALFVAAQMGSLGSLQLLLAERADASIATSLGCSPVLIAAQMDHADAILLLLNASADANCQDSYGVAPVSKASAKDHTKSLNVLAHFKADLNLCDKEGVSPLYFALQNEASSATVQLLLDALADPNQQTDDGISPLMVGVAQESTETLNQLLSAHADPNAVGCNGTQTVMDFLIENVDIADMPPLSRVLKAAGAKRLKDL